MQNQPKRILTGIRPTGKLHLGHYAGALQNWVELQERYECFFLIADYHALADHFDDLELIRQSVVDVALDWMAVGLDPERSHFVVQSQLQESSELAMLLGFITSLGLVKRNPTLKSELDELPAGKRTIGFYSYPVSQVADILLPRAQLVPVGADQVPHIEMTREIARRFNRIYGEVFPEPEALVGRTGRLMGTDGQAKMSKGRGNAILLCDTADDVHRKVNSMYTDPKRVHATDPGQVEGNPVFQYHDAFNPDKRQVEDFKQRYRAGKIGDVEVKRVLVDVLNNFLEPIRVKRAHYSTDLKLVREALRNGTERARAAAQTTMKLVRHAMKIDAYFG